MPGPEREQPDQKDLLNTPLRVSHLPPIEALVAVWTRMEYTKTGHLPTDSQIAAVFPKLEGRIDDILISAGLRQRPVDLSETAVESFPKTQNNNGALPAAFVIHNNGERSIVEERRGRLSGNVKAFFMGLSLGDYQRRPSGYFGRDDLIIATQSDKPSGREMLRRTFGRYKHEETENDRDYKVYVNHDDFRFFEDKSSVNLPQDNEMLAPFLLGLLAAKLTEKERRMSFNKSRKFLASQLDISFRVRFGFKIGHVGIHGEGTPDEMTVIYVKDINKVLEALGNEESVSSLPFFEDVKGLILTPKPAAAA